MKYHSCDGEVQAIIRSNVLCSAKECLESWSLRYDHVKVVRSIWPTIWDVPLIRDLDITISWIKNNRRLLLDVGASNTAYIKEYVSDRLSEISYYSFDIDRRTRQDFYDWEEIKMTFDIITCAEVLEHLSLEQGLELCENMREHLSPGGILLTTVPNIFHANRFLQDPSHKTPWCYDRISADLLCIGFDICGIFRFGYYREPKGIVDWLKAWLELRLRYRLGIDFANSICVLARKPT
jgi:SAM-dependent methyltransferase